MQRQLTLIIDLVGSLVRQSTNHRSLISAVASKDPPTDAVISAMSRFQSEGAANIRLTFDARYPTISPSGQNTQTGPGIAERLLSSIRATIPTHSARAPIA